MDLNPTIGAELEFYLFDENGDSIVDIESGKFPQKRYDVLPQHKAKVEEFCAKFSEYNIEKEDGAGQFEAHFQPKNDVEDIAADIESFIQNSINAVDGLRVNFHPKPLDNQPGSSLHIHLSSDLYDPYGLGLNGGVMLPTVDPNNEYVLWSIGGMLEKMPQPKGMKICFPNADSKSRIKPWMNAPTKICWGKNNRSVAIRIPDSKPKRIEYRLAGSDANPKELIKYVIESAQYGIDNKIEPDEAVFGNAWDGKYKKPLILG